MVVHVYLCTVLRRGKLIELVCADDDDECASQVASGSVTPASLESGGAPSV